MGRRSVRFQVAVAAAAAVLLLLPLFLSGYYEEVHKLVARLVLELLEKADRGGQYAEIYAPANRQKIIDGAWMEDFGGVDGNDRSLRHYYDPETGQGAAFQPYFYTWTELDGASVSAPGLRYPGALEWGRNGAGTRDLRNWRGAIEAYDYSPSSRTEAYFRLGHVVHLVADMAEPDHATNTIHVPSGLYYPKDLNKILAFVKRGLGTVPGLEETKRLLANTMALNEIEGEKLVGFEGLTERFPSRLFTAPPRVASNKSASLDFYFNTMARLSKGAIRGKFALPLGGRFTPGASEADQFGLEGLKANYSFFPAIDFRNPDESERYFQLARGLLTSAIRLNWGLVEFFHDLVDPPPYVRRVEVSQRGRALYSAEWTDVELPDPVTGRHPNDNLTARDKLAKAGFHHEYKYVRIWGRRLPEPLTSSPLESGVEARVRLDFGPRAEGYAARPEAMKEVSVRIGGEAVPGRLIENGAAWVGSFTPAVGDGAEETELQVEIGGRDAQTHPEIPGRLALSRQSALDDRRGFLLDAEPDSPAKTSPDPPYHVLRYEPGTDINHKIRVRAAAGDVEIESAAAASPHLYFEIDGDVIRPNRGDDAWSFTLKLNATADFLAELVSKEEWTLYPDGRLFSTYNRTERRGGQVETWFANVTDLSRPPQGRLSRRGSATHELDTFKIGPDGRATDAFRDGNLLSHYSWVAGRTEQYIRKLRYTGRGRDGSLHQAEFVFDSREWEPAGRNSAGLMTYKKTARAAQQAKQTPLRAEPAPTLEDWKKAAAGEPTATREPGPSAAAGKPGGGSAAMGAAEGGGTPTEKKAASGQAGKSAAATAGRDAAQPALPPGQDRGQPPSGAASGPPAGGGSDAKAVFKRGEELLQNRDYWGAADYFRQTLQAFPAESNQGLGLSYYGGGLYEAALRHFTEAYRLNPRATLTVLYLATCNDKLGRAGEAIRRYEEYLALAPSDPKMVEFVRSRLQALRGR